MANKTIRMTTFRQIIRLKSENHSNRSIVRSLGIARKTVEKYLKLIKTSGLQCSELLELSELDLEGLFSESAKIRTTDRQQVLEQLLPQIEKELKRVGVTRLRLWQEYRQEHPDGYEYAMFNRYLQRWLDKKEVSMHIEHKAGDKMYVDYAGKKLEIVDKDTGEIRKVDVFVAILGASQLTYVEATLSQKKQDFIRATENALLYFGGVPQGIVCDNLKAAVTRSDKYEAEVNETYLDFALHHNTTILPTRALKPKDKALVENAVSIVYKRVYAPLRNKVFHCLGELNLAIKQELENHNNTSFQGKTYSRRELFEEVEKKELKPLPTQLYDFKLYKDYRVHKNSHVFLYEDKHYYSVPYRYITEKVRVIATASKVEIFHKSIRIAFHKRDYTPYKYTTVREHMPSSHNFISDWNPEKFISWAARIGEPTEALIKNILQSKVHPEQAYKSCAGILSYAPKIGNTRLNKACQRALDYGSCNYRTIKNILQKGLDQLDNQQGVQYNLPFHDNIRGKDYYQ